MLYDPVRVVFALPLAPGRLFKSKNSRAPATVHLRFWSGALAGAPEEKALRIALRNAAKGPSTHGEEFIDEVSTKRKRIVNTSSRLRRQILHHV